MSIFMWFVFQANYIDFLFLVCMLQVGICFSWLSPLQPPLLMPLLQLFALEFPWFQSILEL